MENQHKRILGYRDLSQTEIDLMNEIKALGPVIEGVIIKVGKHLEAQQDELYGRVFDPEIWRKAAYGSQLPDEEVKAGLERLKEATPERFAALAKSDFQTALMCLTRAVAQPTFF